MFVSYIDHERIALGNEEGLFVVHVTKDGKRNPSYFRETLNYILESS
jgi:hypothetical protein